MREVETLSFSLGIRDLHPTTEARLRRFLMTRRVVLGHACISPEKANRIATEHSELFRVEVTEGGKGYWKFYFRSLIGNHSTSMEANGRPRLALPARSVGVAPCEAAGLPRADAIARDREDLRATLHGGPKRPGVAGQAICGVGEYR